MNNAFYIGATALEAHQRAVDVLADNIANVNSVAFKRADVQFAELMQSVDGRASDTSAASGADGATGAANDPASLGGVRVSTSDRIFDQGTLNSTGRAMDIAINGDGFMELLGPSGQLLLWRGGTLQVNGDGYLAAANGYPLKQLITVPDNASQLQIAANGKITAILGNASNPTELGQITLAHVRNTAQLTSLGGGVYLDDASQRSVGGNNVVSTTAGQDGAGVLVQGSTEASNVSLTNAMTSLLLVQRIYAANAQVVQAADQLMGLANGLRHS